MYSVSKTIKKQRAKREWVKVILFICLLGFIAVQLFRQDWTELKMSHLTAPFFLLLSFLLIPANQGCEWFKWKRIAAPLVTDPIRLRKAFFGGIGTGFASPNGWGNFLGRIPFFQHRDRLYIALATALSNFSQLLPTLIFGSLGCLATRKIPDYLSSSAAVITGFLVIVYFFGEKLVARIKTRNRIIRHLQRMQQNATEIRMPLFLWSMLRFQVFSVQYVLLFMAFGYTDYWFLLTHVWLIFLLTSFFPSLWSGKLLIRETAAIFVFAGSYVATADIIVVSLTIWLFNHIIPAAVSGFAWLSFSKRSSDVVD